MSLDISLISDSESVWRGNVTHNLVPMAKEVGVYDAVWRPDEFHYDASDVLEEVALSIEWLLLERERFEKLNPENGWGSYEGLVHFLLDYALALSRYPHAEIEVSR